MRTNLMPEWKARPHPWRRTLPSQTSSTLCLEPSRTSKSQPSACSTAAWPQSGNSSQVDRLLYPGTTTVKTFWAVSFFIVELPPGSKRVPWRRGLRCASVQLVKEVKWSHQSWTLHVYSACASRGQEEAFSRRVESATGFLDGSEFKDELLGAVFIKLYKG